MSKFVIKYPQCEDDVYVTVSGGLFNKGIFAKRKVTCPNGHTIDTKTDRMAIRKCPHCGNNVVYDQSKGENAICPVCKTKINTLNDNISAVQIKCPQCGCQHTVAKDGNTMECPVCNTTIDIQREIGKIKMQKANVVSLIKYEGDNNTFVWKHPIEDFKFGSQLIVHDSQEALFFCGGQALDLFGGGTYTLTTEKIPLLNSIYKVPSGEDTFHSEIYFINKTVHTGIKWGTSSRMRIPDPYSGMNLSLGANGIFNIKVVNSKKLILKLIGTTNIFSHSSNINDNTEESGSSNEILNYIKSVIVSKTKIFFASIIKENNWSVFEIDAYVEELSKKIMVGINHELDDYGLSMTEFMVLNISTPEDIVPENNAEKEEQELYIRIKKQVGNKFADIKEEENKADIALVAQKRKLVEAETRAKEKIIEAQGQAESDKIKGFAEAEVQRAQGYTGKDKMMFDVQKKFAENIGNAGGNGGGTLGELIGLGAGMGVLSKIGKQVGNFMDLDDSKTVETTGWVCECGANATGNFCNNCGRPKPTTDSFWICECGAKNTGGDFCNMCGKARIKNETWICQCGATNSAGNFCNKCGRPKE